MQEAAEQHIQQRVQRRREKQHKKRRPGIARRAQGRGIIVVQEAEDQPAEDDGKIVHGLRDRLRLRALPEQDLPGKTEPQHRQEKGNAAAAEQRRCVDAPEPPVVFGTAELADQDAGADTGAEKQGIEDIHHRRRNADAGKGQVAEEPADHDGVDNIIELLEDVAEDNRHGKLQQRRQRRAMEQRFTFPRSNCIHRPYFPCVLNRRIPQKRSLVKPKSQEFRVCGKSVDRRRNLQYNKPDL